MIAAYIEQLELWAIVHELSFTEISGFFVVVCFLGSLNNSIKWKRELAVG